MTAGVHAYHNLNSGHETTSPPFFFIDQKSIVAVSFTILSAVPPAPQRANLTTEDVPIVIRPVRSTEGDYLKTG